MNYYVIMRSLVDINENIIHQLDNWKNELIEVLSAIEAYKTVSAIQGATGEALNDYLDSVHSTIISAIGNEFSDYSSKITPYVNDYLSLEDSEEGIIWSETIQNQIDIIPEEKTIIDDIASSVTDVISSVSDIVSTSVTPNIVPIDMAYDEMTMFLIRLDEAIEEIESNHAGDMDDINGKLKQLMASIIDAKNDSLEVVTVKSHETVIGKSIAKTAITSLCSAGELGSMGSVIGEWGKIVIDNDGISAKDVGLIYSGLMRSIYAAIKSDNNSSLAKSLGLEMSEKIKILKGIAPPREIWQHGEVIVKDAYSKIDGVLKDSFNSSIAWVCSAIVNGCDNYNEYANGEIDGWRALSEWGAETFVDVGKIALSVGCATLACAEVAALIPTIAVGATSALAVGATAVVFCAFADAAVNKYTDVEDVGELISDKVIDKLNQFADYAYDRINAR